MHSLGGRLRVWRDAKSLSQKDISTQLSIPSRTYQDYERGLRLPGAESMECFVRAGINANWLLTGEGPMLLSDLRAAADSFDMARLKLAIQATEEGLAAGGREMAPDRKAELVLAVYDLLREPSVTKERVLKLVKLAA